MDTIDQGLLFAKQLNNDGSNTEVSWQAVNAWRSGDIPLWIHLDRTDNNTQQWLLQHSGLTQETVSALLTEETRPRVFQGKRGTIAILRGVNLNPGQNAEDMIDLRIWCEGERLITLRKTPLQSVQDIRKELSKPANGINSISELFGRLVTRLSERMSPTIETLKLRIEDIEQRLNTDHTTDVREQLLEIRNNAASLHRYLSPQRVALKELEENPPAWADSTWRPVMRDATDMLTYYTEELDAAREQAIIFKEDIDSRISETTNRTLYALAVISGVFLPLAFITGLLGINIGGMPGVDNDSAFWIFCLALVVIAMLEVALFKKLKWI